MISSIKRALYFPVAYYFRFFAKIKLARWKPRIIVVTGSNGKTTTMALIESQLGNKAYYSHHANSSFGIPFNILGLERKSLIVSEWFGLFFFAPFKVFSKVPSQKIYIVEADCDRPHEGNFLSTLLKPEVTIWLSSGRTHSMNFDNLVKNGKFSNVENAIAYEYGYFLENTSKLVIINSDSNLINGEFSRTKARAIRISEKYLREYGVSKTGTLFKIADKTYRFKFLLPNVTFSSIAASLELIGYLNISKDNGFSDFELPPGRSSIFKGTKNTTIIDSCYNSNLGSVTEIINMFNRMKADKKWAVIGDMLEQGKEEKEEHEKLAELIVKSNCDRVILLGPRVMEHGYPILKKHYENRVVAYTSPKDVLSYLQANLEGGETILFKGARFLEGVIEHLLLDKDDIAKLSRREKIWEIRRKKWGL